MNNPVLNKIKKSLRMQVFAWICLLGAFVLVAGISYAWYTKADREADTEQADVMVPYYLKLRNPSETDSLQLSIGSMPLGDVKQIVFCVTGKNPDASSFINKGASEFDYTIELVHTDNLALDYEVYELEVSDAENADIIATDTETDANGNEIKQLTYWEKKSALDPLMGIDVSEERYRQVYGFSDETDVNEELRETNNRGTYISYESNSSGKLHLSSEESHYYVMEIEWDEGASANFDKYKKETELIYVVVKALQPKPESIQ